MHQPINPDEPPPKPSPKAPTDARDRAELVAEPEPDPEPEPEPPPTKAKQRRQRRQLDVERIPVRAWEFADRLRARLLAKFPTLAMRNWPWDPTKKTGNRALWAEVFRVLVQTDGRTWDEIASHLRFLLDADHMFVVHSPGALREKWDNIAAAIARQGKPQPGFARPDNRVPPEYKRWSIDE